MLTRYGEWAFKSSDKISSRRYAAISHPYDSKKIQRLFFFAVSNPGTDGFGFFLVKMPDYFWKGKLEKK